MTREEALNKTIGILTYHQVNFCKSKEAVANMNEIIEALEKIDQEQCGDCISREAALDLIADYDLSMGQVVKGIHALPSVTPQPKMGHWIKDKCSICGEERAWYGQNPPYCPDCGSYNGGDAE